MNQNKTCIIVGLSPSQDQSAIVLRAAKTFAERFDAELVCTSVNIGRYPVDEQPDGTVTSMPYDPDVAEERNEVFDTGLLSVVTDVLKGSTVPWQVQALAGGPAKQLAALAEEMDAEMIIIGTRDAGLLGSLHEVFNGSVAARLAHRQYRPVVVVPTNPDPDDEEPSAQVDE